MKMHQNIYLQDTLELTTETFTPEKILELFDQARFKVLATVVMTMKSLRLKTKEILRQLPSNLVRWQHIDLASLINRAKI